MSAVWTVGHMGAPLSEAPQQAFLPTPPPHPRPLFCVCVCARCVPASACLCLPEPPISSSSFYFLTLLLMCPPPPPLSSSRSALPRSLIEFRFECVRHSCSVCMCACVCVCVSATFPSSSFSLFLETCGVLLFLCVPLSVCVPVCTHM